MERPHQKECAENPKSNSSKVMLKVKAFRNVGQRS